MRNLANIDGVQSRVMQRVNTWAIGNDKAGAGLFRLIEPIGQGRKSAVMKPGSALACSVIAGSVICDALSASADSATVLARDTEVDEIIVYGRGEHLIGRAATASEGALSGADLSVRPLLRVAELLESVPGMIAAQHSGSGKANQYFLRGFNLDHGTDFTTYVDGVPWNLRSHGHGQGYLDINGLIPDTVERIDYRKGTYRADVGDFSMAGASFISTIEQLQRPFLAAETGDRSGPIYQTCVACHQQYAPFRRVGVLEYRSIGLRCGEPALHVWRGTGT